MTHRKSKSLRVSAFLAILCGLAALLVTSAGAASAAPQFRPMVAVHSGKCLDVEGGSLANGARTVQMTCNGEQHQQWVIVPDGDKYVRVIVQHSGQCLQVSGASMANGARVDQGSCHTGTNQLWTKIDMAGGYFHLVAVHSGKCLDVDHSGLVDGTRIIQWPCHYGLNQRWAR